MKFLMGEFLGAGGIGFVYYTTWGAILTYILTIVIGILTIIGLITVIKWFFTRRKPKESPHDKWLRTGKM